MKWYHIRFTHTELNSLEDQKFVKEFIHFCHDRKFPKDLILYGLKFEVDYGQAFYISSPIQLETDLKKWLAHYNAQLTFRPNLNLLYQVAGGNGQSNNLV